MLIRCCFCQSEILGAGNSPWPVNNDSKARCCNFCNTYLVLPARIERMQQSVEAQAKRAK